MQDTSTDYEELANSIQAGYYIKQGIANYNEDLFYMSVFITISAKTYEELMWRKQQMTDMLKSMDMYVSDCSFQQEAALRSVMPFLKIAPSLEKKARRNVLTSGAASTYMFTSYELSDDTGVLLGINRHNNSLCIVDLFNTKKNKNANLNLIGTSGAGKTFTLQLLALRMRMRGIQCYIMAPIKGHEFRRACNAVGGQFIRIAPGSPHCINIMEIRHSNGSVVWELSCECGNTTYKTINTLKTGKVLSCGCLYKLTRSDTVKYRKDLVAGTSISNIVVSKRLRSNNTSGHTGVWHDKKHDRWHAFINFQGEHYNLGTHPTFQSAVKARRAAEERLHDPAIIAHIETLTEERRKEFAMYLRNNGGTI